MLKQHAFRKMAMLKMLIWKAKDLHVSVVNSTATEANVFRRWLMNFPAWLVQGNEGPPSKGTKSIESDLLRSGLAGNLKEH